MNAAGLKVPARRTVLALIASLVTLVVVIIPDALVSAQDIDVDVKVTILEIHALEGFEGPAALDEADWYVVVTIDGVEISNEDTPDQEAVEGNDDIVVNWPFTRPVDLAKGSVAVKIEVRDEDGFLRFGDDLADVAPAANSAILDLTVDLAPCSVSGELAGNCGQTLVGTGTNPADADGRAQVHFKVEVIEPFTAPGVFVRCTHRPIWPQPGEIVTLKVEALDGNLNPRVADSIEIWAEGAVLDQKTGRTRFQIPFGPDPGAESFAYGCRVSDESTEVFSGWRRVSIGDPPASRAIPVLFNENRPNAVDVLFIPDQDSYTGATDPSFIDSVESAVFDPDLGIYSELIFVARQDLVNFWLAPDLGDADGDQNTCFTPFTTPPNYGTDYLFADAVAILHTDVFRDCAPSNRLFSSEPPSVSGERTIVHEFGHRPFSLADEYCHKRPGSQGGTCDGGYWESLQFPNVFDSLAECQADAPTLNRPPSACQEWTGDPPSDPGPWFTFDFPVNDLMVDRGPAQALDVRRITWFFDQCEQVGGIC